MIDLLVDIFGRREPDRLRASLKKVAGDGPYTPGTYCLLRGVAVAHYEAWRKV